MPRQLRKGINDLASMFPDIAKEWDYEKNYPFTPETVCYGSNKRVLWRCAKCGHEWAQQINVRTAGNGCPECGRKSSVLHRHENIVKNHSLSILRPDLALEWDYTKNGTLTPNNVACGSHTQCFWICPLGHSYSARVANRVYKNDGCSYCANRKILPGFNDLETIYPFIARQWDYIKNYPKTPKEVFPAESNKYYWICPTCQTSYSASISNRVKGKGCKNCSKSGTSFPEQAIFYYINQLFPDAQNRNNDFGFELDVYIPSLRTAIEYDGVRYHASDSIYLKDCRKNAYCSELGIRLIRLRDPSLKDIKDAEVIKCRDTNEEALQKSIILLCTELSKNNANYSEIVDIQRDRFTILAFSLSNKHKKSILFTYPEIASEWNYEKNSPLTPEFLTAGMRVKAYWKCSQCGNSYPMYIYERTGQGKGCPKCGKAKAAKNKSKTAALNNGLAVHFPELMKEIDPNDNPGLDIDALSAGTQTKIVWTCSTCGHKWKAAVSTRTHGGGCTICGRRRTSEAARVSVINIDTGIAYPSLTDAAASCNGDKRKICKCCQGNIELAYGFHWKYADSSHPIGKKERWVVENIETKEEFKTITAAAKKYVVDRTSIASAISGKTQTSCGYHWRKKYID